MKVNDMKAARIYKLPMPRKAANSATFDWYLVDWMAAKKINQAEMARQCGWSKATMHDIYHGTTAFYRDILVTAAAALMIEPFQLLLPPERAYKMMQLEGALMRQVAETKAEWIADNPPEPLPTSRPG